MAELSGVVVLQSEIEKAKDKLRGYNENIRKLTGRDPSRPGIRRLLTSEGAEREENDYPNRAARGRGRIFGMARHSIMEDNGPPAKRRAVGGAFSRLGPVPARRRDREDSPYEEELPNKLSVHSSVVATSRESKNRKEIMQEQTKDKEGMQRNRRMFGLLLGTLNKFKTESKTMETKEVQRKKIEDKLEENAEKEKRKFKMETKLLIEEMHLEQSKISRLQQKMEMVQEHAEREEEVKKLKNFIVTKTKPRIFWKPQQMSAALENKLKESRKFVDGMLQESNDRLEKEIKELMERENKREERIKMRLREDGLLEDEEGKGEVGEDEGNKNEGMGESGRVVEVKEEIDQENPVADRLGRDHEEKELDAEIEDLGDSRKKSRRTVIVEREVSSGSESEEMEHGNHETDKSDDQDKDTAGLDKENVNKSGALSSLDEPGVGKMGGKSDELSSHRDKDDKEHGNDTSEDDSDSEREPQPAKERHRNKGRDEHRNKKARSHKDSKKDRKRDGKEDSEDRDRSKKDKKRDEKEDNEERDRSKKDRKRDGKEDSEERDRSKKDKKRDEKEDERDRSKDRKRDEKEDSEDRDRSKKDRKRDEKEGSEERDRSKKDRKRDEKEGSEERDRSKKDRKRDEKEGSEERDRDRRRRSEDKRRPKHGSGDKGRAKRDSHEEKRDKERRRDSHDSSKKSGSRHPKDRKRYTDSEDSDVEIKQEKEVSKHKDITHSELSNRSRDTDGGKVQKRSKVVDDDEMVID